MVLVRQQIRFGEFCWKFPETWLLHIYLNIQRARRNKCIIIMVIITIIFIITRVGTMKWHYLELLPTILEDSGTKIHSATSRIDLAWFQGRLLNKQLRN